MQKCNKCGFIHYISDGCRKPKESAATRIEEGMREVLAVARGEAVPHAVHERDVRPIADTIQKPKHKDRHKPGYMAAYLRKWRRGEVGNKYKKEIGK